MKVLYNFKNYFLDSVIKSWWVFLFITLSYVIYNQSVKQKEIELISLQKSFLDMQNEKQLCLNEQEDLKERLASQNDPAWIERLLIKELGVVPEGYLKVYFKKKNG